MFQSHDFASEKHGDAFSVTKMGDPVMDAEADDLQNPAVYDFNYSNAVLHAFEDKFSIPKKRPNEHRSAPGTFYVLGAEENGRFVIQGAGYLSRDITTKPSANAFKVVFSDRTPYELFRKWLVADPPLALKSIFARVLTNLDGKTVDANDPNGVSIGKMAQAVPPKEGHFAFFDGPVTAQPVAHFVRNY
ncbi:hypothetical protein A3J32_02920 [Candidatus Saccharibacteria bacterium RIFCSPLOWO2_02_FULL_46_7]|nr:MAG: hypothetical protein A3J32_02920 [Candidatus Saccharibacteria bacterium RIFCSPLOWO2_02_FULL_46_7]